LAVLGAEERFGAIAGEVLHPVDDLAAHVVPLARHAFGYLLLSQEPSASSTATEAMFSRTGQLEGSSLAQQLLVEEGRDVGIGARRAGLAVKSKPASTLPGYGH